MGKLTALMVSRQTTKGMYGDGDGLWLQVGPTGRRSWSFRYMIKGRAREMGLGPYPVVTLAQARQAALGAKQQIFAGEDPIRVREIEKIKQVSTTFKEVTELYLEAHESSWKNPIHRRQWRNTMIADVNPKIGDTPIGAITVDDIVDILEPIWKKKAETASRIRGRIEAILDYASARGWRTGDNPARWRGHLETLFPEVSKIAKVKHLAALPWKDVGKFVHNLRTEKLLPARGLEFLILTATRTNETIGAKWSEIDMGESLWVIPADRMKMDLEHRVPLSTAAVKLLKELPRESDWVFPGGSRGKPMGGQSFRRLILDQEFTIHGFRSTFSDWAAEATDHSSDIVEVALAHTEKNKVKGAYQRGDLLDKRRTLMEDWANFIGEK